MHAKQRRKVMQVGIVVELVGMRVMCECVLMLPHDGVTQEGHAPYASIVNERHSTDAVVTSVVTQSAQKPAGERQYKT